MRLGTILMCCRWCRSRPGEPCKYKRRIIAGRFHSVRVDDAELASDLIDDEVPGVADVGRVIGGRRTRARLGDA